MKIIYSDEETKGIMNIQVGIVVISRAFQIYDPGLIPRLRTRAEICRSQSDCEGYSSFPPSANSTATPRSEQLSNSILAFG